MNASLLTLSYIQDDAILQKKVNQWLQCDPATKDQIRAGVRQLIM